jgi:hypothetical protein
MALQKIKTSYRPIQDRNLDKRSYLTFEFPNPEQGGGRINVRLPFFENIKIRERKRANYQKYNLLSRPSELFTYTGAQARRFSITFDMTFPHILAEHGDIAVGYISLFQNFTGPSLEKLKFSNLPADQKISGTAKKYAADFSGYNYTGQVVDTNTGLLESVLNGVDNFLGGILGDQPNDGVPLEFKNPLAQTKLKMVDLIVYWTNLIRSSVTNYSPNPIYGPPVVRINHGILFQGIPCICNDYSIQPIEEGGYDLETMLPRKIRYTLNLSEIRAGDFGEWNPDNSVARDNVVGWEATIQNKKNSMDPGRFDLK